MDDNKKPALAGTGTRVNIKTSSPRILHHDAHCRNCGTPLYPREFRHCRPCRGYLALWRALVEMSQIGGGLS